MPRLKRDCPTKVAVLSPEQTESPVCDTNLVAIKHLKVENRSPSVELGDPLPSRAELHLRKLEKAYLDTSAYYEDLSNKLDEEELEDTKQEGDLCNEMDEARQSKNAIKRAIQKYCREHNLHSTLLKKYEQTHYIFEGTSSKYLNHLISEQINSLSQPDLVDIMNMVEKAYRNEGLSAAGEEKQNSAMVLHDMVCEEINLVRALLFEKKFEELVKTLPEDEEKPPETLRNCFESSLEHCRERLESLKRQNDLESNKDDEQPVPGITIFDRQLKTDTGEIVQSKKTSLSSDVWDQREAVGRSNGRLRTLHNSPVEGNRGRKRGTVSPGFEKAVQPTEEESMTPLPTNPLPFLHHAHPHLSSASAERQRCNSSREVSEKPRWTTEHAETLLNAQCFVALPVCELKGARTAIRITRTVKSTPI